MADKNIRFQSLQQVGLLERLAGSNVDDRPLAGGDILQQLIEQGFSVARSLSTTFSTKALAMPRALPTFLKKFVVP
jgi:hypothetical protein